jgi:hypothetical protein
LLVVTIVLVGFNQRLMISGWSAAPAWANDSANSASNPGHLGPPPYSKFATDLPAAILARMLGIHIPIHISVAVAWQRASSGDWTTYAAEVSRRTVRRGRHSDSWSIWRRQRQSSKKTSFAIIKHT